MGTELRPSSDVSRMGDLGKGRREDGNKGNEGNFMNGNGNSVLLLSTWCCGIVIWKLEVGGSSAFQYSRHIAVDRSSKEYEALSSIRNLN
jgi:hypothetical protein